MTLTDMFHSLESKVAGFALKGPLGRYLYYVDDEENDPARFDDWDIEMYRWDRLQQQLSNEVRALRRLRPLWGQGVSTFYGTVELARSGETIAHPSISTVSGLLVEYVEGEALDCEKRGDYSIPPTDEDQARGQAILNVVRKAHALGVVHRDLSWRNVIQRPGGSFALIDWGLARCREPEHSADDWLAIRAQARDLTSLREVIEHSTRYDPTPVDMEEPDPGCGYSFVNSAALSVRDPTRRSAWFESVPCPEPGYTMVRVPGNNAEYRWEYRRFRVRPGIRVRETYKEDLGPAICVRLELDDTIHAANADPAHNLELLWWHLSAASFRTMLLVAQSSSYRQQKPGDANATIFP
ncbi:hypothetical protein AURDEDRAFT_160374 [Auricularia subglabra TFB-10046 SS5]|nr:hypothetical protein AURDEDRAFT_160374 [Auricularia subglabra TFB-10046 SS5]